MANDMTPLVSEEAALIDRARRWSARAEDLARDPALTQIGAERALDHLGTLQTVMEQTRSRISRPCRSELHRVEAPLKASEAALKAARAALSEAALRARPSADRVRTDNAENAAEGIFGLLPARGDAPDAAVHEDTAQASTETRTVRAISACRALLDLEALRPYLGDAALRQAISEHLNATARHDVAGVTYATLPKSAELVCDIH